MRGRRPSARRVYTHCTVLTEAGLSMARISRNVPGQLLALYLILDVIALACVAVAHPALPERAQPFSLPVAAFLTWRVWRGGRPSRVILITLSMLSFAGVAFTSASAWNLSAPGLLAIYATQIALLVSPAAYQQTSPNLPPPRAGAASKAG